MATVSAPLLTIGPKDAGRRMTLDEFVAANQGEDHHRYELARGVVVVTNIPGIHHGWIVQRVMRLFAGYEVAFPGRIVYQAAGSDCRIRLAGQQSDRHPDQAVYLTPPPTGPRLWQRWVPAIVVEVVSRHGEERDYVQKRDEYLRFGVLEYWIVDPYRRTMTTLLRTGDVWDWHELKEDAVHRTELLRGLEVPVGAILGPPIDVEGEDDGDGDVEVEPAPAV